MRRDPQISLNTEHLMYIASIHFEANARTGDPRQAFVETVRRALTEGYHPLACWVTDAMIRTGRPTHAVVLGHAESTRAFFVIVGGVMGGWATDIESEAYSPETGRGWRAIQGEALDLYMRWARQEPVEQEYVVGMEPG